jgi:hypothetical protein
VGKRQQEQEDEFGVLVRDWMMMAQGLRGRNNTATMIREKTKHKIIDFRLVSIYSPLSAGLYQNVSDADCIHRVSNSC